VADDTLLCMQSSGLGQSHSDMLQMVQAA
jgi:hypothetical protein